MSTVSNHNVTVSSSYVRVASIFDSVHRTGGRKVCPIGCWMSMCNIDEKPCPLPLLRAAARRTPRRAPQRTGHMSHRQHVCCLPRAALHSRAPTRSCRPSSMEAKGRGRDNTTPQLHARHPSRPHPHTSHHALIRYIKSHTPRHKTQLVYSRRELPTLGHITAVCTIRFCTCPLAHYNAFATRVGWETLNGRHR